MLDWGAIPWVGVLVAVIATQIIGFVWYGPLFGKTWMAAIGKTPESMKADPNQASVAQAVTGGVIASILSAITLALLLSLSDTPDVASGLQIGLLVSVGIMAANQVSGGLYEGRSATATWINVAYSIFSLTIMGLIIGAMW